MGSAPPFFIYDSPPGPSATLLSGCYAVLKKGQWPWGQNQPSHVSTAVWVIEALLRNRARLREPEQAEVLLVPAVGALSEAAGTCGASHYQRMLDWADVLRSSSEFRRRPERHLLIAAADTPRNLLGELGTLAAQRGAMAACLDTSNCGLFKRVVTLPWVPQPELAKPKWRAQADAEACGNAPERPLLLFFRGSLCRTKEAQALRVRIALLSTLDRAEVRLVGEDAVHPSTASYAASHRISLARGKHDVNAYVRGMTRARFCLAPVGDQASPGRRIFDALAAGCVPLIVGDRPMLPFSSTVDYFKFAPAVSRAAFLKDPVLAIEATMHRLEPTLPLLRRAQADARQRLGFGTGEFGPLANSTTFGNAAEQLLVEARRLAGSGWMNRSAPVLG